MQALEAIQFDWRGPEAYTMHKAQRAFTAAVSAELAPVAKAGSAAAQLAHAKLDGGAVAAADIGLDYFGFTGKTTWDVVKYLASLLDPGPQSDFVPAMTPEEKFAAVQASFLDLKAF